VQLCQISSLTVAIITVVVIVIIVIIIIIDIITGVLPQLLSALLVLLSHLRSRTPCPVVLRCDIWALLHLLHLLLSSQAASASPSHLEGSTSDRRYQPSPSPSTTPLHRNPPLSSPH
jgi:hypothetical protein